MARRNKGLENIFGILLFLALLGMVIDFAKIVLAWLSDNRTIVAVVLGVVGSVVIISVIAQKNRQRQQKIRRLQKHADLISRLNSVSISDNRHDYMISNEDYRRGNKRENEYRKRYFLTLLQLYDNQCAKCGDAYNGVDLDHFVFSKNEGGNFSLMHKDGYFVNNAIPLCQACNRSKGDRSYKDFFSKEKLIAIFHKNRKMTFFINNENEPQ